MSKPPLERELFRSILKLISSRVLFAVCGSLLLTPVIFITRVGESRQARHVQVGRNRVSRQQATSLVLGLALLFSFGLNLSRPVQSAAVASSNINFQARLESASGAIAPDGNYNVEFKIYKSLAAGASAAGVCVGGATDDCYWKEDYLNSASQGVHVVNGYLTVNLGSITAFGATIPWDQSLYITMNIGGTGGGAPSYDGEMSPRLKLTAVPYAFQAKQSQTLVQTLAGGGTGTGTLDFQSLTADRKYLLPDSILATTASPGTICLFNGTSSNCPAATGSAYYIQNTGGSLTPQAAANFNVQATSSGTAGTIGGIIEAATGGQTVDLFQLQNSSGTILSHFASNGNLALGTTAAPTSVLTVGTNTTTAAGGITFGTDTNLYRSGSNALTTAGSLNVNNGLVVSQNATNVNQNSITNLSGTLSTSGAFNGAYGLLSQPVIAPAGGTVNYFYGQFTQASASPTAGAVITFLNGSNNRNAISGVSPTGTITSSYQLQADVVANFATGTPAVTITNQTGLLVAQQGSGSGTNGLTIQNAIGVDVAAQTGAATSNIGVRIAKGNTYSLQLSDTGGTAAGGITFGTDANLYRSAASTLKTDGNLSVVGNTNVTGNVGIGAPTPDAKLDVNGSTVNSNGNFTHYQNLASYSFTGAETGTKRITLPRGWTNTMMSVTIKGYDYSTAGTWEAVIGGYNYAAGPYWYNTSAEIRGKAPFSSIRLAYDGTNMVLLLGTTATVWQYPKLEVSDFYAGYSNVTGWGSSWTIANDTTETGIVNILTPVVPLTVSSAGALNLNGATSISGSNTLTVGTGTTTLGGTLNANGPLNATGATLFKNTANSAVAFQIQNAAATTTLLAADTTNTKLTVTGTLNNIGGGSFVGLSAPAAPTVTNQGAAGTTSYTYAITARNANNGETLASTGTVNSTGNATLDSTNFNRITWAAVAGAKDYRIYRIVSGGTPSTTGLIGTVVQGNALQLDDTGLAAAGSTPFSDSSRYLGVGTSSPTAVLSLATSNLAGSTFNPALSYSNQILYGSTSGSSATATYAAWNPQNSRWEASATSAIISPMLFNYGYNGTYSIQEAGIANRNVGDALSFVTALQILSTGEVDLGNNAFKVLPSGDISVTSTYNTNTFTSSALTFGSAGAAAISSAAGQNLTVDSGTTGTLNLGTGASAKTIQIGTTTGAVAQTINVGNNATASSSTILNLGSTIGSSATTLQAGSGGITATALLTGNQGAIFTGPATTTLTIGQKDARVLLQNNSYTANAGGEVVLGAIADTNTGRYASVGTDIQSNTGTGAYGNVYIATKSLATDASLTRRLTVLSSGEVGVGVTPTGGGSLLQVGGNISTTSTGTITSAGLLTASAGLSVTGNASFLKGTDYTTVGTTNDVVLGNGSLIRLTGASAQTITGIAGGTDGRILTLVNAAAQAATLTNNDVASTTAGDRILTGTGGSISIPADASVTLDYDVTATRWRVVGGVAANGGVGVNTVGNIDTGNGGTKVANGAFINGTTIFLQTADGSNVGLVSTGAQTLAGAKTFSGALTASTGLTVTAGGATITAGGLTVTAGNTTLTALNAVGVVHNSAAGLLSTSAIVNADLQSGTFTSITGTGALVAGSIASGFGSIATTNTISTSSNISTTGSGTITSAGILNANAAGKTAITIADSGAQNSGLTIGGDTNLYRSAAGTLKTDNNFIAGGGLTVAGTTLLQGSTETTAQLNTPFGGLGRYANLLKYSEQFDNSGGWVAAAGATVTANTIVAPDGSTTADSVNYTTTSSNNVLEQIVTTGSALANRTFTLSIWAKAGTSSALQLYMRTSPSSADITAQNFTLTSNWQRYTFTKTFAGGDTDTNVDVLLRNNVALGTMSFWGAQLEEAGSAGVYQSTTTNISSSGTGSYGAVVDGSFLQSGTGNATFTGLLQANLGLTVSGATISLNNSSNFNTAINSGTSTGTIAIGNSASTGFTLETGSTAASLFNGATAHTINLATGAAVQALTIGSTNSTSATTIQAGTGNLQLTTQGTGTLGIGNNAVAQNIAVGNATGATNVTIAGGIGNSIQLQSQGTILIGNNAVAQTITIGNSTGATAINLQAGTNGINLGTNGIANTIQIGNTSGAVAQTINLGTNATASSTTTLNIGSTIAGITTLQSAGGVKVSTLAAGSATSQSLCRDTSSLLLTSCDANNSTGAAFLNGLNTLSGTATLGTNSTGGGSLQIQTNSVARATFDTANNLYLGNADATGVNAAPANFSLKGTTSSSVANAGGNLSLIAGNGASATTGSAGGVLNLQGGAAGTVSTTANAKAGGAVNITGGAAAGLGAATANGGAVTINGGTPFSTGLLGTVALQTADGAVTIGSGAAASTSTIAIGATTGTGTITLGQSTSGQAINIGTAGNANNAVTIEAGNTGTIAIGNGATAHTINIGSGAAVQALTIGSTNSTSATTIQAGSGNLNFNAAQAQFTEITGTRTLTAQTRSTNLAGTALTISGGAAGAGANGLTGGTLTLQGGAAGGSTNANGANVVVQGGAGTGTGVQGLVTLATSVFTAAGTQAFAASGTITQSVVDNFSTIPVNNSGATSVVVTVPAPTQNVVGRIVYITAVNGSVSFNLAPSGGTQFSMNANSTATLIWNGSAWTNAGVDGGSSSYIQNQNSVDQTGNYRITGVGQANGGLLAPSLDVVTATSTLSLGTAAGNGAITIGRSGITTTNAGALTVTQTGTFNGGLTIATGSTLTNASSTLNTAVALGNLNYSGSGNTGTIGAASATVDVATTFTIAQTTASQTLTVPSPTATTAGRIIYITNTGTVSFTLLGATISTGTSATLVWSGTAWTFAGADASSIVNQNTVNQTANFRITGVGQANGGLSVGVASSTAGSLTLYNSVNSFKTILQASSAVQDQTITIPVGTGTTDTLCLAVTKNCSAVGAAGGDLGGTYPNPTIALLQGKTLTITAGTPTTGAVLQYNGSAFVDGLVTNTNLASGNFTQITGVGTLTTGLTAQGAAINLNANSNFATNINTGTSTGAVTIGNTSNAANATTIQGGTTGGINIGSIGATTTGSTIHIADTSSTTGAQAVTIGSTAANSGNLTILQGGSSAVVGTEAIRILPGTAGAIAIGASAGTGTITLGQSTASNTVNIGNATIAAGNTGTINIGTSSTGTGSTAITVGSTNGNSTTTIQAGDGATGGISLNVTGTNNRGTVVKSTTTNSTTAFQVQNANGQAVLTQDTTTGRLTVNQGGLTVKGQQAPVPSVATSTTGGTLAAASYYYKVSAIGLSGESVAAAPASNFPMTTTGTTSQNTVSWSLISSATTYKVYRSTDNTNWFVNTVGNVASIVDNGSTYTWASSGTPSGSSTSGDVNLLSGASLNFDSSLSGYSGGNAKIYYGQQYKNFIVSNTTTAGDIELQSDSFAVMDTTGYNVNLAINNTGAATFKNRVNSTTAFQIQNAAASPVLSVDTTNSRVGIGIAAPTQTLDVRGSAYFKLPSAASTTAFQIQSNSGTYTLLNIDTTNNFVGIGTATPSSAFDVRSSSDGLGQTAMKISASDNATNGGYLALNQYSSAGGAYGAIQSADGVGYRNLALNPLGGKVGIGTATAPGNLLSVGALTTASAGAQIAVSTGGVNNSGIVVQSVASQASGNFLQAQDSTGASLAKIDYQGNLTVTGATATGLVTLGSGGNAVTVDATNHQVRYAGTSRNTKTIALTPEFPGMVLSGSGVGTLTSGFDAANFHNYYNWTTAQASAQAYDMVVRVPVPRDFAAFSSSGNSTIPVCVNVWSDDASQVVVNQQIYDTANATAGTNAITPTATSTWQAKCTNYSFTTVTAGGTTYLTFKITANVNQNKNLRIGEVTVDYLSAY